MGKRFSNLSKILTVILFMIVQSLCYAQWEKIPELEYTTVYCMLTTSENTIFVGGDEWTLIRSTDDGKTWTNVWGNGFWADTILSLGQGLGYIFAGSHGVGSMHRSSDNGESWESAKDGFPTAAKVNAFAFAGTKLYAASDYGVFSSADSGGFWNIDTAGLGLGEIYPHHDDGMSGIVSSDSILYTLKSRGAEVYSTSVDSISWKKISSEYYGAGLAMVEMDNNVFIATNEGVYVYSGGTTWLPRNNGLPISGTTNLGWCIFTKSEDLLFANILLAPGYTSSIFYTSDLGENWIKVDNNDFSESSINAITVNEDYIFAGTEDGGWRLHLSNIVPVELVSFLAKVDKNNIILTWLTATETNNKGFEIERKRSTSLRNNNSKWEKVVFLEGKGTTTQEQLYSYFDNNLPSGKYLYRLKQIDFDGAFEYSNIIEVEVGTPENFSLAQNFPNPFNPVTKISWQSPVSNWQTLKIYDVLGREVKTLVDEYKPAGNYEVEFDASGLASGLYYYRLSSGDFTEVKKMVQMK